MKTAQVLGCSQQHFSTDYLTNEKLRNVFCSEKAEHGDILPKALDVLTQTLMNPKISLQDNRVIGFIDDLFKIINKNKEKPNFKLCSIIARKLGFNVNANGTRLLIRGILYLYENNHKWFLHALFQCLHLRLQILHQPKQTQFHPSWVESWRAFKSIPSLLQQRLCKWSLFKFRNWRYNRQHYGKDHRNCKNP